jgi:hypothetical protein
MSCAICEKRPPKRFCPAKGEKICAICCGEGREVAIDCPIDCSYLIAAHRYEDEHRKPTPREEFPYPDLQFPVDFVYEKWPVVAGLGGTIHRFQLENKELNDAESLLAYKRSRKRIARSELEFIMSGRPMPRSRVRCMDSSRHSCRSLRKKSRLVQASRR